MKIKLPTDHPIDLPECDTWPKGRHQFDPIAVHAINAALATGRPLLVRGEPGTGKSQLARAVAAHMGWLFVAEVVHARSESQDLLWHLDAVSRLGEAQAVAAQRSGDGVVPDLKERLDPLSYMAPGPLWWVFDWGSADRQSRRCKRYRHRRPERPHDEWQADGGRVLLIDEIDKADADLPNGLLETLGNGRFGVPHHEETITVCKGELPPLVVITTNEERELPAAFLRRCLVLHLWLPDDDPKNRDHPPETKRKQLISWLVARGRVHFAEVDQPLDGEVMREAAGHLADDRQLAEQHGVTKPGQAEYLDLLTALHELAPGDKVRQLELLLAIKPFMLKKSEELHEAQGSHEPTP